MTMNVVSFVGDLEEGRENSRFDSLKPLSDYNLLENEFSFLSKDIHFLAKQVQQFLMKRAANRRNTPINGW
jgi:hypothetical protein